MRPKIIIIGIGFVSRLGLIRAVAKLGADIDVIVIVVGHETHKPIDCYSKYVGRIFYCKGNNQKRILELLTEKCIDQRRKVVLIPANDFAASVLDKNLELLERHFLMPHICHKQGAITMWMNKEKQKKWCNQQVLELPSRRTLKLKMGFTKYQTRFVTLVLPKQDLTQQDTNRRFTVVTTKKNCA